jgi:hypothetical protein
MTFNMSWIRVALVEWESTMQVFVVVFDTEHGRTIRVSATKEGALHIAESFVDDTRQEMEESVDDSEASEMLKMMDEALTSASGPEIEKAIEIYNNFHSHFVSAADQHELAIRECPVESP